jgi:hypothetical protein
MKKYRSMLLGGWLLVAAAPVAQPARGPVLVELFTSEGCSSCPPADELLMELEQSSPGGLIVLSEHVDYWNRLGWVDPFATAGFSRRQEDYARRWRLGSVYTPQVVVDGAREMVGSDRAGVLKAVAEAGARPKVPVILQPGARGPAGVGVSVRVPPFGSAAPGEVFLAVAEGPLQSSVARGENAGRLLRHTAVVRKWLDLGSARPGSGFSASVQVPLEAGWDPAHLKVVAFVQEAEGGTVLGAATARLVAH